MHPPCSCYSSCYRLSPSLRVQLGNIVGHCPSSSPRYSTVRCNSCPQARYFLLSKMEKLLSMLNLVGFCCFLHWGYGAAPREVSSPRHKHRCRWTLGSTAKYRRHLLGEEIRSFKTPVLFRTDFVRVTETQPRSLSKSPVQMYQKHMRRCSIFSITPGQPSSKDDRDPSWIHRSPWGPSLAQEIDERLWPLPPDHRTISKTPAHWRQHLHLAPFLIYIRNVNIAHHVRGTDNVRGVAGRGVHDGEGPVLHYRRWLLADEGLAGGWV